MMSRLARIFRVAATVTAIAFGATAGPVPTAVAELGPEGASVVDAGGSVVLSVAMSQAIPWRVGSLDGPPRIVVEFGELVWSDEPSVESASIVEARVEPVRPGWSQLALSLHEPLMVTTAEMVLADDGTARLEVTLVPTTAEEFRRLASPDGTLVGHGEADASGGLSTVVIDPGHGGLDPGAMFDDLVEADLMLVIARRLRDDLIQTGRFKVVLTREEDVFVPLEARLTLAREAGADAFLSLHADMLEPEDGLASGMTVYRLSEAGTKAADTRLTERHAANDLLSGVDLTGAGDDVALALMDLVRLETAPRTLALQRTLIRSFEAAGLAVNSRAERQGSLAVLKSAEIPSVLIELGFLSSERDRDRLASDGWQVEASQALTDALLLWQDEDRLTREAMRQ